MKRLNLLILTAALSFSAAAQTPVGPDVAPNMVSVARDAANLVKADGYRCDSVDFFMWYESENAFRLTCNNNRFFYHLYRVNGRLLVVPQ